MFRLSMLILIFMLAGCATTQYGNFVAANDDAHNKSIAHDVTQQLIRFIHRRALNSICNTQHWIHLVML